MSIEARQQGITHNYHIPSTLSRQYTKRRPAIRAIECMSAPTPTDEQIGKLFDQHTDVSVLLNPISPTHAMTRTAAIQFAKALFGQFKSES